MKKIIFLTLILSVALLFISCEGDTNTQPEATIGNEETVSETATTVETTASEIVVETVTTTETTASEIVVETVTIEETTSDEETVAETVTTTEVTSAEETVAETVTTAEVTSDEETVAETVTTVEVTSGEETVVETVTTVETTAPETVAEIVTTAEVTSEETVAETVTTKEATSNEETVAETVTTEEATNDEETVAETVTTEEPAETDEITEPNTSINAEETSQISEETTEEKTEITKYTALEFGASDSGVVNHKLDIVLNKTTYVDTTSDTLKSVDFLGTEYNAKYEKSEKGYYYNENVDYFEVTDKYAHDFGINRNTGRIDVCEMYMVNYAQIKEGSQKLSRDECQEIALDILKQYVNLDEYVLTKAATGDLIEYKVYDFWFTRIIDGVKTNDKAYIVITEYGDLFNYIFTCLGEMKDAIVPTKEELSDMKVAIDTKVNSIYANVKKSYTVEYEIRDEYFVRLADGSYAMEYVVDVNLTPNDPEGLKLKEKISLLVYV